MEKEVREKCSRDCYEMMRFFANGCGCRVAGTENARKASDFIKEYFEDLQDLGVEVETFDFEVPIADFEYSSFAAKVNGEWIDFPHLPAMFAADTPEGGLTVPFVYVGNGSDYELNKKDVNGKAVLITRDVLMNYPDIATYRKLHARGAKMVIYTTTDGQQALPSVYANYELRDDEAMMPTVTMMDADALKLVRYNVSEVHYEVKYGEIKKGIGRNVIARLPGTDKAEEEIMCSGHIDSAYGSLGVTDDVGACAVTMETLKYFAKRKKEGMPLHRTLSCACWSGHEPGSHGSKFYLLAHPETADHVRFIANYDIVGHCLGDYTVDMAANPEMVDLIQKYMDDEGFGWPVLTNLVTAGDPFNYAGKQIPYFFFHDTHVNTNHSAGDNLTLVSPTSYESMMDFSEGLVRMLDELDTIPQGYPKEMNEFAEMSAKKYGKIYLK